MCDPVSLTLGAVAGGTVLQAREQRKAAQEARDTGSAAAAEASAQQSAQRELAATRERRRQQTLLMTGAPQPTFGDTAETTLMSAGANARMSRQPVGPSLMSRGAAQ